MKHSNYRAGAACLIVAAAWATAGQATLLNLDDYERALGGAKNQQVALPGQIVTFTDRYGSFTAATSSSPVDTSYIPAGPWQSSVSPNPAQEVSRGFPEGALTDGASGSLRGFYTCRTYFAGCLGVDTITYKLPFAIQAISGNLVIQGETMMQVTPDLSFFGLRFQDYLDQAQLPSYVPGRFFSGFWGMTFDTPTDTLTIARTRLIDERLEFTLSGAQVVAAREGNNGNGPVRVPEPSALLLLLTGLLGLGLVQRRA